MRKNLLEQRNELVDSIFYGLPWNKRKIDAIDHSLDVINNFMYSTVKMGLHRESPYWQRWRTVLLIDSIKTETIWK